MCYQMKAFSVREKKEKHRIKKIKKTTALYPSWKYQYDLVILHMYFLALSSERV